MQKLHGIVLLKFWSLFKKKPKDLSQRDLLLLSVSRMLDDKTGVFEYKCYLNNKDAPYGIYKEYKFTFGNGKSIKATITGGESYYNGYNRKIVGMYVASVNDMHFNRHNDDKMAEKIYKLLSKKHKKCK